MTLRVGDYRHHLDWGVGKVRTVTPGDRPDVTIDFERQPDHTASVTWIERETSPVNPNGLRAIAFEDYSYAQQMLRDEPVRAFELVLKDFPNQRAKNDALKDYLGRYINWDDWWERVQPLLKEAPHIDTSRSRQREYGLRFEALSEAEEAYDHFRRLQAKGDWVAAHEQAKTTLNIAHRGQILGPEAQERLKAYFQQYRSDPSQLFEGRLDALFRLMSMGWISETDGRAEVRTWLTPNLRLYDVGLFAQTRLLRMLLDSGVESAELPLIASGMCADEDTAKRVIDWLSRRGATHELELGLQFALTEKLPNTLDDIRSFNRRLVDSQRILRYLPTQNTNWEIVASWVRQMAWHMARIASSGWLDEFDFSALLRLTQGIWMRAGDKSQVLGAGVLSAVADVSLPRPFLEGLVLTAQTDAEILPQFVESMTNHLLTATDDRHQDLLTVILGRSNLTPEQQVREYVSRARKSADKPAALAWLAEHVIGLARPLLDDQLEPVLVDLDILSRLGNGRPWRERVDAQRERGYRYLIRQTLNVRTSSSGPSEGFLDAAVMGAFRSVVAETTRDIQQELDSLRKQMELTNEELRDIKLRAAQSETALGEVARERRGRVDEVRFEERFRLMQEFAKSVGEIERFAARQGNPSPEIKALLVRLNSILRGNKVEVSAFLGDLIEFNPATCQTVSGAPLAPGEQVRVVESGYLIRDHLGTMRLLKPALVVRP